MRSFRIEIYILVALTLNGCSSVPLRDGAQASNQLFCDSYFNYFMCARDIDGNGDVDIMYFQDTHEIFMKSQSYDGRLMEGLSLHTCVQTMDANMRAAGTRLLTINEYTSALEKTNIKTRLILNYSRYLSSIEACQNDTYLSSAEEDLPPEDYFDQDFEDF